MLSIKGAYLYCSPFSYRPTNFAIVKLSLLIPLLKFLYKLCRLVHGFFSASHYTVIALPTIATAIVVALLHS